jgi:hypothetical protein
MKISKQEALQIETFVMLTKVGDFVITVEQSLEIQKRAGLAQLIQMFGVDRRLSSPGRRLFNSHRRRFEDDMARFLRYSAATTVYSLFETLLKRTINLIEDDSPARLRFKTIRKSKPNIGFILQAREFLEFPGNPIILEHRRLWSLLDDLRILRNCIVHTHGDLSLASPATQKDIRKTIGRIRKTGIKEEMIFLERGFALNVLERVELFFAEVFRAAGFRVATPPGTLESFARAISGFEDKILRDIQSYKAGKTANLGGGL